MGTPIGFIGIGNMGAPMMLRLVKAGLDVRVFDLSPELMGKAKEAGAGACSSLRQAAETCDPILMCLPTPASVEQVVLGAGGLRDHAPADVVIVDMTTSQPTTTLRLEAELQARGIHMLDAPVTGGPIGANAGTLSVMVGGSREIFERCRPVLAVIAPRNLQHVGPIGSGHVMKLVNNLIAATSRWALAEASVWATKAGIDPETLIRVLNDCSGQTYHTRIVWPAYILKGQINQAFTLGLMVKDLNLGLSMAEDLRMPAFLSTEVKHLYDMLSIRYGHQADVNSVVPYFEEQAGVAVRSRGVE